MYLKYIFAIERQLQQAEYDEHTFVALRTKITEPALVALYEHCQKERNTILPRSKYGEALEYCSNQWELLIAYRNHPWCGLDNTFVDQIIRHFVVGRKNLLFANTVSGPWTITLLYSLVQTAKVNNKEPYKYLYTLFTQLPNVQSDNDFYLLLPHRIAL